MILILLILLENANEEAIEIFNRLDNDKKLLLLKLFRKVFIEEFDKEIAKYKRIYEDYEKQRVELSILYEFGVEQGYIKEQNSFDNDIDLEILTHFQDIDSIEDML